MSDSAALAVSGLSVRFRGVVAVDEVTFDLQPNSILGIIGPNGAGKTTLLDAISGFVPSTGQVFLSGYEVTHAATPARARMGLGRSFQDGRLFPSLTVTETVKVSLERQQPRMGPVRAALWIGPSARAERKIAERADEIISFMGLDPFRERFIGELSTGSRRIVDLACVAAHRPEVLLLDEPSSGIAQKETEALGPLLLKIREEIGCSMIVVEHDMPLIKSISDELLAMETGRVIARGTPEAVVNDPAVVEAYLGVDQGVVARSGAIGGDAS